MGILFYALLAAVAVSGALVGRWWALLTPFVVWPCYFLGLGQGWWGSGLGDGWPVGLLGVVAISLALVAGGLALRPRFWADAERRTR